MENNKLDPPTLLFIPDYVISGLAAKNGQVISITQHQILSSFYEFSYVADTATQAIPHGDMKDIVALNQKLYKTLFNVNFIHQIFEESAVRPLSDEIRYLPDDLIKTANDVLGCYYDEDIELVKEGKLNSDVVTQITSNNIVYVIVKRGFGNIVNLRKYDDIRPISIGLMNLMFNKVGDAKVFASTLFRAFNRLG